MRYVFDTSPLSTLFKNYYPRRFPTLWSQFDALVQSRAIRSTREVFRELDEGPVEAARDWANNNLLVFPPPTAAEGSFVARIYAVPHFQANIEQQKLYKGGRNADPFVIAKASVDECTVVTLEKMKANAAKIPNICAHFSIPCMSLEEFMENENWEF